MVKKTKVVEIDNVETSSSKMKLLSPTDETPETVEIDNVETPKTVEIPEPEQPQEETSDEQVEEVKPPKETKPKKQDEKITCSICNKTMLMKTYKYTHQKLCKPVEQVMIKSKVLEPKSKMVEEKPKAKEASLPNLGEVSFKEYKEMPDPLDIYRAAKEQRQQVRNSKS